MKEPSAISLLTNAELLTIYERSSLLMAGGTQEQIANQTKAHAELRRCVIARMDRGVGPIPASEGAAFTPKPTYFPTPSGE